MNIVLIGMRGSGKSTVGKLLSDKLNFSLIETDILVEKATKMPIKEIVKIWGWVKFRKLETEVLNSLININKAVIATGGGIVVKETNQKILKKLGKIIYLYAPVETLVKRVENNQDRPMLTEVTNMKDDLIKVYNQRKGIYKKLADWKINTQNLSVIDVVNRIIKLIKTQTKVC